jgi:hypothetical protein
MTIDDMVVEIARCLSRLEGSATALEAKANRLIMGEDNKEDTFAITPDQARVEGLREGARAIREALAGDIPTIILREN